MALIFDKIEKYKVLIDYYDFDVVNEKKYFKRGGKKITEIAFQSDEFLIDIITCGMPQFHLRRNIFLKRLDELKYKMYLIRASLEIDKEGYIVVSDNIKYLDSSEKAFVSYYTGMYITKLISREIFDYDYLVHYGIVKNYKSIDRDKDDKREPDLIAFCRKKDEYSIFEAKGRQYVQKKMISHAKNQIKSIHGISGLKPDLGVVSVAHPIKEGSRIKCSMYDPKLEKQETIVTKDELLYLYYLPIYELITENQIDESTSCEFEVNWDKRGIKFRVKMDKELFDFFKENTNRAIRSDEMQNGRLCKIIDKINDNRVDVGVMAEWIERL